MATKRKPPLRLEWIDPADLADNPSNWRTHPEKQIKALDAALDEVGWAGALLYNEKSKRLIDGHARKRIRSGQGPVPVLIGSWTEEQEKVILATLDPLGAMAEANGEALKALLKDVSTGSDALAEMLKGLAADNGVSVDPDVPEDAGPQIDKADELLQKWGVKPGDLWTAESKATPGKSHRLLCGDSTKAEDVVRVMNGESVDTIVSDPPYGIGFDTDYRRFTSGFDVPRTNHSPVANDDKPFDPVPWLEYKRVVLWGANCFSSKLPLGTWLVWDKRFANGTAMLSDAEVAWMKTGHGVYIFAQTSQGFVRPEAIEHPTQKPVSVIAWCIEKCKAGPLILDPFLGSGTTIVAAEQTARLCYGLEIEPKYVAVILERLTALGLKVTRETAPKAKARPRKTDT